MRLVGRRVRRIVEQRGVERRRHGDRRTAAAHRHPRLPGTAGGGGDQARDQRHQQGGRRARQGRHRGRGRYVGRRACRPEHVSRAVRAVEAPVGRDRTRRIGRRQERLQEHRRREDPSDLNGIDVDDALRHGPVLLPHRRPGCRAGRGDGRPHRAGRREEARHRLLQRRVRHRHARHHSAEAQGCRRRRGVRREGRLRPSRDELLVDRDGDQELRRRRDADHLVRSRRWPPPAWTRTSSI